MPRSVDEEFVAQRNEMRRIDQSSDFMTGYVYRVDREARTADIMTSSGVLMEDLPGHAGFLPEPGQQVQLLMNGNAPVLMPPNTADIVSLGARIDAAFGPNLLPDVFANGGATSLINNFSFEETEPGATTDLLTIGAMAAWWDFSNAANTRTSGAFQTVVDKSGNSRSLTQGTAGNRPVDTNFVNGKRVATFDGVDDYMTSTSFSLTQPHTVYVVVANAPGNGAQQRILAAMTSTWTLQKSTSNRWEIAAGASLAPAINPTSRPTMLVGTFNGNESSLVSQTDDELNPNMESGAAGTNGITGGIRVGASSTPNNYLIGRVCEIAIFVGVHNDEQRAAVYGYFRNRWGISEPQRWTPSNGRANRREDIFESFGASAVLRNTVTNSTVSLISNPIPIRKHAYFTARVRARGLPGVAARNVTVSVQFKDAAGNDLAAVSKTPGLDSNAAWTTFEVRGQVPPTAETVFASVSIPMGTAGEEHAIDTYLVFEPVPGWDASYGAKAFQFDTGVDGWAALSGSSTISQVTTGIVPVSGAGVLKVTNVSGGTNWGAYGPVGGIPAVPGTVVNATGNIHAATVSRSARISIRFYDSSNTLISTSDGPLVATDVLSWVNLAHSASAPSNTVSAAVVIYCTTGANGEFYYIDSAIITGAATADIDLTIDPPYLWAKPYGVVMVAKANGAVNMFAPSGSGGINAARVAPGEFYQVDWRYINWVGNVSSKPMIAVATWYSEFGIFMGVTFGTLPGTAPGTVSTPAQETFQVPPGAYGMRVQLGWFASLGDIIVVQDATLRKVSTMAAKLIPIGNLPNLDGKYISVPNWALVTANAWTASQAITMRNPQVPVRVIVMFSCTITLNAALAGNVRIGISFDGGTTWTYGQQKSWYDGVDRDGAGFDYVPLSAVHGRTGMPTNNIMVRAEANPVATGSAATISFADFLIFTYPAPAAGEV